MASRFTAPAEGWNQNRQRNIAVFFDQHRSAEFPDGRPWWCYTERSADGSSAPMPVGEMQPVNAEITLGDGTKIPGWEAPWVPEPKYMAHSVQRLSGNRFRIDYQRQIADYRAAQEDYYRRAVQEAAAFNLPMPELGEAPSYKLRMIVGNPPKSPKIPEAALAGDRWLLGFSDEPNEQLRRLLYTGDGRIAAPEEFASSDTPKRRGKAAAA
jgi:hypothetical protein